MVNILDLKVLDSVKHYSIPIKKWHCAFEARHAEKTKTYPVVLKPEMTVKVEERQKRTDLHFVVIQHV